MFKIDENINTYEELKKLADASKNIKSKYYLVCDRLRNMGYYYYKAEVIRMLDKEWNSAPSNEYRFKLAQDLVDQNYDYGYYLLGDFYDRGVGTNQDFSKAFENLLKTFEMGNYGYSFLVYYYLSGEHVPYSPEKALEVAEKANDAKFLEKTRELCSCLNSGTKEKLDKAAYYYQNRSYRNAICLYNSIETIDDDLANFYYAHSLFNKDGYTRMKKAYEIISILKEKGYTNENFSSVYRYIKDRYEMYQPHSFVGMYKTDTCWNSECLLSEQSPHFWQLYNEIIQNRNRGYFVDAWIGSNYLVELYPDSGLARLCRLLARACIVFEDNARFFDMQKVFDGIQYFSDYNCLEYFDEQQKKYVMKLFNAMDKRNQYNLRQLDRYCGKHTYHYQDYPVVMMSQPEDERTNECGRRLKEVLNKNGLNCYFQSDQNLMDNSTGVYLERFVRINNCKIIIMISASETGGLPWAFFNAADDLIEYPEEDSQIRLIYIGPESRRELIGYRFQVHAYLDINSPNLENELLRTIRMLENDRGEDYWYKKLNDEIVKLKSKEIRDYEKFAKDFCTEHNLKYNFPSMRYSDGKIRLIKIGDCYVKGKPIIDAYHESAIFYDMAMDVIFKQEVCHEIKLFDLKMKLVASDCENSKKVKKLSGGLKIHVGLTKQPICDEGIYYAEITVYKGSDKNGPILGKVGSLVCLKYWEFAPE